MPKKPYITDELRKTWEATIRAAVHPNDYKIKNIDDVIPVPKVEVKEEVKVSVDDSVEVNSK